MHSKFQSSELNDLMVIGAEDIFACVKSPKIDFIFHGKVYFSYIYSSCCCCCWLFGTHWMKWKQAYFISKYHFLDRYFIYVCISLCWHRIYGSCLSCRRHLQIRRLANKSFGIKETWEKKEHQSSTTFLTKKTKRKCKGKVVVTKVRVTPQHELSDLWWSTIDPKTCVFLNSYLHNIFSQGLHTEQRKKEK